MEEGREKRRDGGACTDLSRVPFMKGGDCLKKRVA